MVNQKSILFIISILLTLSFFAGRMIKPTWTVEKITLDIKSDDQGSQFYTYKNKPAYIDNLRAIENSPLSPANIANLNLTKGQPEITEDFVYETTTKEQSQEIVYYHLVIMKHWRYWSLLPAVVAILLCWVTREPMLSLASGIVAGALLLGKYNVIEDVLIPSLSTKGAAGVLILYLWLLGGLLGVWSKNGAAKAFAELMTQHVVRGPRSAKLVAWFLGVIFFQGGTMSTVLVGTTVKPIADKEKISHEELSYIVDSTASPIASQLAFNAWPGYIQAFIFIPGVAFLVTESDRVKFFFSSVPFCFYAIFAVLGTFLLSIDKSPFLGKKLRAAINRSRETGKLDNDDAEPLSAEELQQVHVPDYYKPHFMEFILPLGILIGIAIGTFIVMGTPQIYWAFGLALFFAMTITLLRGMSLMDLVDGFHSGLKGVVLGSVILLLAITIGKMSKETGGGIYLVKLLGNDIPFWILPVVLQILTIIIAFSTGTSWGTYAVAFPLAMPLAWAVASSSDLAHPQFYLTLCFAAVMDGSVFGDQCSPISDTTVLSSVCTGCDLMDHVKTQIPQATFAAILAAICWTSLTFLTV